MLINYINTISAKDYNQLRQSVGWSVPDELSSQKSLDNSLYICCATVNGISIGSGRVVGDGTLAFCIQDVMVHPEFQRRFGVGKHIMKYLLTYIKSAAKSQSDIYCMSAQGCEAFYMAVGFIKRPSSSLGAGMVLPFDALKHH
ncbi:MAG: GNAT family N-acetyltransferase [Plesiomonas sp.]|uniref:GNAT family N-acetyltransferase n=1 Tax=Plesiomonas sp. TaxID=2486279 RepID=UPI003F2E5E91